MISLPFSTFYTNSDLVMFSYNVSTHIASYSSSHLKVSTGKRCPIYQLDSPSFRFYCYITRNTETKFEFEPGCFTNSMGLTNEATVFVVVHSAAKLTASLSWRSRAFVPLVMQIEFSQSMDWSVYRLQDWIQVSNGVVDELEVEDDTNVEVYIIPKSRGELVVTLTNRRVWMGGVIGRIQFRVFNEPMRECSGGLARAGDHHQLLERLHAHGGLHNAQLSRSLPHLHPLL